MFAQLDRGVLGIWGTDGDDTIVVRQLAGRLSVDGVDILVRGVEVPSVTVGSVRRIEIACGAGDDEVYLNSHTVPGQQAITRPAYIWGEAGDDWIEAGQGHDTVDAGTGEDVVFGHGGNDVLWAEGSACWLYGGAGNDRVEAMAGEMVLDGGPGHDRMQAYGDGPAWVDGGPGNDRLIGGDGPDVLTGGPGNDYLLGGGGADDLDGGPGTDIMWGGWEPWRETLDDGVDTFRDEFSPTAITYRGAGLADVLQGGSPLCVTAASIAAAVRAGFDFRLSIAHLGGHEYAVALFDPTLGRWQAERVWFDGTWTDLDLNIPRARSGATLPEFWTVLVGRATLQQRGVDWTVADLDYVDRWYPTSASGMLGRLTGWETEALDPADLQAQDLWYALRSGQAVAALTFDDPPSAMYTPGIVPNHAYTVLAVYRSGSSWYVRLRNPWGVDFDPSVSRRPMGADDGIVALRWDHFVADFFAVAWSV